MTLPLRPELAGLEPYGAPQLDVAVRLNVNENPYPPSARVVADIAAAVVEAAGGLNRYPDRDFADLRADLSAYLRRESGVDLDPSGLWAANGSNEVMLHLLQAFGGPGRTALSFAPTYSMYPEYARDTSTGWVVGRRDDDFGVDPDHAAAMIAEHAPSVVLLASPNNPTGTALPLGTVRRGARRRRSGARRVRGGGRRGLRRVPSRRCAVGAHPALTTTRTSRSAGRCPRPSGWPEPAWGTWPPRPHSSTRCAWCDCRTTCQRSRRRWRAPRSRTRPS